MMFRVHPRSLAFENASFSEASGIYSAVFKEWQIAEIAARLVKRGDK